MSDPIWDKVYELTQGYPAEFNVAPVYELVRDAWRMGFNVTRDPEAPLLYLNAIRAQNNALRNANPFPAAGNNRNDDHALNCPCAQCKGDPVKQAALREMQKAQGITS